MSKNYNTMITLVSDSGYYRGWHAADATEAEVESVVEAIDEILGRKLAELKGEK